MTAQERADIFAKEILTIADIQALYGMSYNKASIYITTLKRRLKIVFKQELRLKMEGKIHIADYLDALELAQDNPRYTPVARECAEVQEDA